MSLESMQIELVNIDDLKAFARNSRTHSDDQVAQIAGSIKEFGFTNPVLIDGDGGIIAGHGRVMAARKLSMNQVPCLRLDGLSEAQKRAYVIADNKLALNAGWDLEMLRLELDELQKIGFDIALTGFSALEINELLLEDPSDKDPDEVPDLPVNPISKMGDTWICGPHKVRCGDSTKAEDWKALMGTEQCDAVWCDPPYNVAYESKLAGKIKNDSMSNDSFYQFLFDYYANVITVMKAGAPIYVAHADTEGLNFRGAFKAAGFKLSGCLIWKKNSLVLGRSDYQWMHEPILYGWKPGSSHKWYGGRKQVTVQDLGEGSMFEKLSDGRYAFRDGDCWQ